MPEIVIKLEESRVEQVYMLLREASNITNRAYMLLRFSEMKTKQARWVAKYGKRGIYDSVLYKGPTCDEFVEDFSRPLTTTIADAEEAIYKATREADELLFEVQEV